MIQTRQVSVTISDFDGSPLAGAKVSIKLVGLGKGTGGFVAPNIKSQLTNNSGVCTFTLWQNEGAYSDTHYEIKSWHPITGRHIHSGEEFIVGGENADIRDLINLPPGSTYLPRPATSFNKRIVILGSSVAAGAGASYGWGARLASALLALGYEVINVSISGNKTSDCINRFYSDVAPLNPYAVIIGLSLANEGLARLANHEAVYRSFINGISQLIEMNRQIGAHTIIGGVYAQNVYTAKEYYYLKLADSQLSKIEGVPYIPFLGQIDDGSGHWESGMFTDAGHPNDIGAESMFRAFDLKLFNNLNRYRAALNVVNGWALKLPSTAGAMPFYYQPDTPFGCVTVMFKLRFGAASLIGQPICSLVGSFAIPLRIRNQLGNYEVAAGYTTIIDSGIASTGPDARWLTIVFDYHVNVAKLYVDGVFSGQAVAAGASDITAVAWAQRPDSLGFDGLDYEYSQFMVWRTALTADQVLAVTRGEIYTGGLVVYSPCADGLALQDARLTNLAPTDGAILLGAQPALV